MNLLEMFKALKEDEKIAFVNMLIDVINSCIKDNESSNPYTVTITEYSHLKKILDSASI